ncbi:unnamed protein product [Lasius platythorax]|uniref:Uncharacterized protein n=1 Tax=Lasius platythorax TaxID=488582 RepID=A0AAV2PA91_9HYME
MHQKCSGHIHRAIWRILRPLVPHFLADVAFFCGRCAKYAWQLNFERHDRDSLTNLFNFNTFRDAAIGSPIEGYIQDVTYPRGDVKQDRQQCACLYG